MPEAEEVEQDQINHQRLHLEKEEMVEVEQEQLEEDLYHKVKQELLTQVVEGVEVVFVDQDQTYLEEQEVQESLLLEHQDQ
jgi:hypothetical protein